MTIMKQALVVAGSFLLLSSCKKDVEETGTDRRTITTPAARVLASGTNTEFERVCANATGWDDHIGITDNPNFGRYSPAPNQAQDIHFSGACVNTVKVWLNDSLYTPDSDGQWLRNSLSLKQWFGKRCTSG